MSELSDDSPSREQSSRWVFWAEILGAWVLAAAVVWIGGLFVVSYLFWHPDNVRRTTSPRAEVHNFETQGSWAMVILQGTGAMLGMLVVAVGLPLALHHLLCRRLGWPKLTMAPVLLVAAVATIAVAVILGAGAIHEGVTIDRINQRIEFRSRSLTDVVRSDDGRRVTIRPRDVARIEYVYQTNEGAEGPVPSEAEVHLQLVTGGSVSVPTGAGPSPAYAVALELAELTHAPLDCFTKRDNTTPKQSSDCIA